MAVHNYNATARMARHYNSKAGGIHQKEEPKTITLGLGVIILLLGIVAWFMIAAAFIIGAVALLYSTYCMFGVLGLIMMLILLALILIGMY